MTAVRDEVRPPHRPDLAGVAWVFGVLAGLDGLVALWAVRNLVLWRRTPDVSDIDGAFFDPHGYVALMSLALGLLSLLALPLLVHLAVRVALARRGLATRLRVGGAVLAGGVFWALVGAGAVWLDRSTADLVDPMIGGPNGASLLEPLGCAFVVAGGVVVLVGARMCVARGGLEARR